MKEIEPLALFSGFFFISQMPGMSIAGHIK